MRVIYVLSYPPAHPSRNTLFLKVHGTKTQASQTIIKSKPAQQWTPTSTGSLSLRLYAHLETSPAIRVSGIGTKLLFTIACRKISDWIALAGLSSRITLGPKAPYLYLARMVRPRLPESLSPPG